MNRAMKDSGVEWIGEIPEHWKINKLKRVISTPLQYGANESGEPYDEMLPRYIRITDITTDNRLKNTGKLSLPEKTATPYILKNNDILFARSGGTVGKTFIYKEEYGKSAFAGYLIKASIQEELNPLWVYYYTLSYSYEKWKEQVFIQSTIQNIGAAKYANMHLPIPSSIEEQNKIINFLDEKTTRIDSIISQTKESIEAFKAYKQALITETVTKGLNLDVKMKDSAIEWIGEIPEHWDVNTAKRVFRKEKRPIINDEIVTAFRDGEVTQRRNRRTDGFTMADKEIGYQGVNPGDLVIHAMDAFAGAIGVSDSSGKCSPVCSICTPIIEANPYYYAYLLRTYSILGYIESMAKGIRERSTDFRYATFAITPLVQPPIHEQQQIVDFLDEKITHIDALIADKEKMVQELEDYKKALIYEYVTGKKEV